MAHAVIMPRQGQSVESCILTEWYKAVGDPVAAGELLFAYETDKAAFEEEVPEDGVLLARFFEEGDEVPVLQNVAVIGKKGEEVGDLRPPEAAGAGRRTEQAEIPEHGITETGNPEPAPVPVDPGKATRGSSISPRARRLAIGKRVVMEGLQGSGPLGRIIERDVEDAVRQGRRLTPLAKKKMEAEGLTVPSGGGEGGKYRTRDLQKPSTPESAPEGRGSYKEVPLTQIRKIIAAAMYRSLQNSAQLTHHLSANVSGMLQLRRMVKEKKSGGYPYHITLNDMVCYAVVKSLLLHPGANAHFVNERIRIFDQVNLGLAVDTDRGLMVPALLQANRYSLPEFSVRLKELADQSKKGAISPDVIVPEAATFTVSNLGNYGVEMFTPVINLPQVAILGVNTIIQRPATLSDGSFGFQPFMGLSLTYDHRALDGGPATLFLAEIKKQIEQLSPDLL